MLGFSKLATSLSTVLLLGLGCVCLAQAPEKAKTKAPAPKATPKPSPPKPSPPKPGLTKPAAPTSEPKAPAEPKKPSPPVKPIPDDEPADEKSAKKGEDEHQDDGDVKGEAAILKSAEAFVEAYNKHDAKAIAELFAEKAEFLDEDGNLIKGREEIEQNFAEVFKQHPDGKIEIQVESIRMLTPHIALEEGLVIGTPMPDGPQMHSNYMAIHVQVEGNWKLASVSDTDAVSEQLTAHDHLQQLAWMVGDWMDESPDAIIKSACDWDASGNYLLHEFAVQISGGLSASGSIRIGWDPLTRQIKSWVFDADSGYSEGLWTRIGDEWLVHTRGVDADGAVTSAISVYRYIDDDTFSWRSYDRTVGGEAEDDIPENLIKRHPPVPEVEAAAVEPPK